MYGKVGAKHKNEFIKGEENMKKMIAFALSAVMVMGLTACSSGTQTTQTEPAKTETAATAETAKQEAGESAAGGETAVWPTGTVTVVVPAAAGSTLDLNARIMTTYLQNKTGCPFVVTNDVTGNGTVAYETVRNAKPDGSTLLFTQNLFIQARGGIYNQEPWDNFEVVGDGGENTEAYILVAKSGKEYSNWEEFAEYAKAHPGELVAGIQNGGQAHMLQAILGEQAGLEFQMVEAGSSADKITGILGGYIDVAFVSTPTGAGYVEAGDLIGLMTTTPERSTFNSEWPTSAELGYPDVKILTRTSWFVPKGMDAQLKEAINSACAGMETDADVEEQLGKLSIKYTHYSVEESENLVKESDELLKEGYKLMEASQS